MARKVSKEDLGFILLQAICASKNIRAQLDRLQQLHWQLRQAAAVRAQRDRLLQLHRHTAAEEEDDGGAGRLGELVSGLVDVYSAGLGAGARYLTVCLKVAAENGAHVALNPSFAGMPDEQLYDALPSQDLPALSGTQAEAFSRLESALYAAKLAEKHHLPRCVEHLANVARPDDDDTVAGATERLAKIRLSDPYGAVTALPSPLPRSSSKTSPGTRSMKQALSYLDRACTLESLAVQHTEVAVFVFSCFLSPIPR